MAEAVVHSVPGSPFGRAVLAALEEKGVRYRVQRVEPQTRNGPQHLARHPFGRVPVLEDGGFRLYETQAILRYIDRVFADPPLTPADPRAAARMDQLMGINDWYLFPEAGRTIVFQRVVAPRLLGAPPDEGVIAAALPGARRVLAEIARLIGDNTFLAGPALSLADLMIAPQLDMLAATPEWQDLAPPHPTLVAWLARVVARPSFVATTAQLVADMVQAG